jgi:hypothetical protein
MFVLWIEQVALRFIVCDYPSGLGLLGCGAVQCCLGYQRFGGPCCLHLQGEVNGAGKGRKYIALETLNL